MYNNTEEGETGKQECTELWENRHWIINYRVETFQVVSSTQWLEEKKEIGGRKMQQNQENLWMKLSQQFLRFLAHKQIVNLINYL